MILDKQKEQHLISLYATGQISIKELESQGVMVARINRTFTEEEMKTIKAVNDFFGPLTEEEQLFHQENYLNSFIKSKK